MNKKEVEEYLNILGGKLTISILKNAKKVNDEDEKEFIINKNNYNKLLENNYSIPQLKSICKQLGFKVGGTKQELLMRLYTHFYLTNKAIKLQSVIKGYFVRTFLKLHGPAYLNNKINNVSLCTNQSDFYSMEPIEEIHPLQRFTYKDEDGFIYGFDIRSLYHLVAQTENKLQVPNPYNRNIIPHNILNNGRRLIHLSYTINQPVMLALEEDTENIDEAKAVELEALRLFQIINGLGNYSDMKWFMNLNQNQLVKFLRELIDIWNYRAQIAEETKVAICPPFGSPFSHINRLSFQQLVALEINQLRNHMLIIIDKLVTSGIDTGSKSLGAFYVLGALTLVSQSAAEALPWLYQSVI